MSVDSEDIGDSKRKKEQALLQKAKKIAESRKKINDEYERLNKAYGDLLISGNKSNEEIKKAFEDYFLTERMLDKIKKDKLDYDQRRIVRQYIPKLDAADLKRLEEAYEAFIKNKISEMELDMALMKEGIRSNLSPGEISDQLSADGVVSLDVIKKLEASQDKFMEALRADKIPKSPNNSTLESQLDEARIKVNGDYQRILIARKLLERDLSSLTDEGVMSLEKKKLQDLQAKIKHEEDEQIRARKENQSNALRLKAEHAKNMGELEVLRGQMRELNLSKERLKIEVGVAEDNIKRKEEELRGLSARNDEEQEKELKSRKELEDDKLKFQKVEKELAEKKNEVDNLWSEVIKAEIDPEITTIIRVLPLLQRARYKQNAGKLSDEQWRLLLDALCEKEPKSKKFESDIEKNQLRNSLKDDFKKMQTETEGVKAHFSDPSFPLKVKRISSEWTAKLGNYYANAKNKHHKALITAYEKNNSELFNLENRVSSEAGVVKKKVREYEEKIKKLEESFSKNEPISLARREIDRLQAALSSIKEKQKGNLDSVRSKEAEFQKLKDLTAVKIGVNVSSEQDKAQEKLNVLKTEESGLLKKASEREFNINKLSERIKALEIDIEKRKYITKNELDDLIKFTAGNVGLNTRLQKLKEEQIQLGNKVLDDMTISSDSLLWRIAKDRILNDAGLSSGKASNILELNKLSSLAADDFNDVMELFGHENVTTQYDSVKNKTDANIVEMLKLMLHKIPDGNRDVLTLLVEQSHKKDRSDKEFYNSMDEQGEEFILNLIEKAKDEIEKLDRNKSVVNKENTIKILDKIRGQILQRRKNKVEAEAQQLKKFSEAQVEKFVQNITLLSDALVSNAPFKEGSSVSETNHSADPASNRMRTGRIVDFISMDNDDIQSPVNVLKVWKTTLAKKLREAAVETNKEKRAEQFSEARNHIHSLMPLLKGQVYVDHIYTEDFEVLRSDPNDKILNAVVKEILHEVDDLQENMIPIKFHAEANTQLLKTQESDQIKDKIAAWEKEKASFTQEEERLNRERMSVKPPKKQKKNEDEVAQNITMSQSQDSNLEGNQKYEILNPDAEPDLMPMAPKDPVSVSQEARQKAWDENLALHEEIVSLEKALEIAKHNYEFNLDILSKQLAEAQETNATYASEMDSIKSSHDSELQDLRKNAEDARAQAQKIADEAKAKVALTESALKQTQEAYERARSELDSQKRAQADALKNKEAELQASFDKQSAEQRQDFEKQGNEQAQQLQVYEKEQKKLIEQLQTFKKDRDELNSLKKEHADLRDKMETTTQDMFEIQERLHVSSQQLAEAQDRNASNTFTMARIQGSYASKLQDLRKKAEENARAEAQANILREETDRKAREELASEREKMAAEKEKLAAEFKEVNDKVKNEIPALQAKLASETTELQARLDQETAEVAKLKTAFTEQESKIRSEFDNQLMRQKEDLHAQLQQQYESNLKSEKSIHEAALRERDKQLNEALARQETELRASFGESSAKQTQNFEKERNERAQQLRQFEKVENERIEQLQTLEKERKERIEQLQQFDKDRKELIEQFKKEKAERQRSYEGKMQALRDRLVILERQIAQYKEAERNRAKEQIDSAAQATMPVAAASSQPKKEPKKEIERNIGKPAAAPAKGPLQFHPSHPSLVQGQRVAPPGQRVAPPGQAGKINHVNVNPIHQKNKKPRIQMDLGMDQDIELAAPVQRPPEASDKIHDENRGAGASDRELNFAKQSTILGGLYDLVIERAGKIGKKSKENKLGKMVSLALDDKAWNEYVGKMKKTIAKKADINDMEGQDELDILFKEREKAGSRYSRKQWEEHRSLKGTLYENWRIDNSEVEDLSSGFEIQHKDDPDSNIFVTKAIVTRNKANKTIEFLAEDSRPDDVTILMMLEHAREVAKQTGNWEIKISDCEDSPEEAHKIEELALKMKLTPIFDEKSKKALETYRHENDIPPPEHPNSPAGMGKNLRFTGK